MDKGDTNYGNANATQRLLVPLDCPVLAEDQHAEFINRAHGSFGTGPVSKQTIH